MPDWLEKAVFYKIYPPSFFDSNADGIGDLPGILEKLEYLQYLGINAVWLNPCFASPFQDAGYDVSDFYQVAPRYGTNDDLRTLFVEARRLGIRILLDLVPGHTSTENTWFKQSCQAERNQYSDWYIWTNSVWTWNAPGVQTVIGYSERDGNYITNFFHFQPALNYGFANPDPEHPWQQPVDVPGPQAVRQELKNIMKFWLDLGASGFRVDMAGSLVKNDPGNQATARLWQEIRMAGPGVSRGCTRLRVVQPNCGHSGRLSYGFPAAICQPGIFSPLPIAEKSIFPGGARLLRPGTTGQHPAFPG